MLTCLIYFLVQIERNGHESNYGDFRVSSKDSIFIIIQINNLRTVTRNDMRLYINCKPGPRTYLEPGLTVLASRRNVQVKLLRSGVQWCTLNIMRTKLSSQ